MRASAWAELSWALPVACYHSVCFVVLCWWWFWLLVIIVHVLLFFVMGGSGCLLSQCVFCCFCSECCQLLIITPRLHANVFYWKRKLFFTDTRFVYTKTVKMHTKTHQNVFTSKTLSKVETFENAAKETQCKCRVNAENVNLET